MLLGNLIWTPPAHADAVVVLGSCAGPDDYSVSRCVWVNYDAARGVFRARAQIKDETSFPDLGWNVAARLPELCSDHGCSKYPEYDNWHEVSDDIHSNLGSCATGRRRVWVRADFGWANGQHEFSQTLTANGYVC
jgi:hypothetical protein